MNSSNPLTAFATHWLGKINATLIVILLYIYAKAMTTPDGKVNDTIEDIATATGLAWGTVQLKLRELAALGAIEVLSGSRERTLIRIPARYWLPPASIGEPDPVHKNIPELVYGLCGQPASPHLLKIMMAAAGNDELRLTHCLEDFLGQPGKRWAAVELLTTAVQDELRPRGFFDGRWSRP